VEDVKIRAVRVTVAAPSAEDRAFSRRFGVDALTIHERIALRSGGLQVVVRAHVELVDGRRIELGRALPLVVDPDDAASEVLGCVWSLTEFDELSQHLGREGLRASQWQLGAAPRTIALSPEVAAWLGED
jgi:hypothetical protein